jgi:tetratricopeptide (TPR) repeat protein
MLAGRFDEAVHQFTDLISMNPESPWAHRYRANAHRGAGKYEEALVDLERSWECESSEPGAGSSWLLFQRVTPLWIVGRLDEAAEMCVLAHEKMLIPTYADARQFLILQSLERTAEGEEVMKRALATCRDAWLRKIFECLNGQLAPADLVKAAANDEHLCEAYYYAGESCLLHGQTTEALEWFQKCVDTQLLFDPNTWTLEPMNEYELARWRLESLTGGAQVATHSKGG